MGGPKKRMERSTDTNVILTFTSVVYVQNAEIFRGVKVMIERQEAKTVYRF